ncbi:MAG: hypothetical protein P4L90_09970 [Rhodopila sp.]|nr:hypothetical protein [Rhodopila sp.]
MARAAPQSVNPATMQPIATIDERYQSYNVEMAEVIGGNFWKPYGSLDAAARTTPAAPAGAIPQIGQGSAMFEPRPPVNLADPRLIKLAAALGPAYVRVSGTWANSAYFQNSDDAPLKTPPTGYQGVLTRREWAGVIGFTKVVDAKLVTSFSISAGVRDKDGRWTPREAQPLLAYTNSIGGQIAAAELFNEPTIAAMGGAPTGYDATSFARDIAAFRAFAKTAAPAMQIVGPGSVGEGVAVVPASVPKLKTEDLLSASPRPVFGVFSYHFYGAASMRCASMGAEMMTSEAAALSNDWLSRTDKVFAFYKALRDRFEPGRPIWVTETADAACGGNPWAPTFLDSFRYLDQLGRLARHGVKAVFHNTLASSEYGLIDQATMVPRPNYWAALLWRQLMGTTVLNAESSNADLRLYAHCMRGRPGGVTVLAINTSRTQAASLDLPSASTGYTLTARQLSDRTVQLNGQDLAVAANGDVPTLGGEPVPAGARELGPASITFLTFPDAPNKSCR